MIKSKIYADFNNTDPQGRIRLNCVGTIEDLARHQIELREGLPLTVYSDDVNDKGALDELLADAVVAYSEEERCWVATIDWNKLRHASDEAVRTTNNQRRTPQ